MIKKLLRTGIGKVATDFGLNLLASLIATGVSQLVLYPALAYLLGETEYGELVTLMGVLNTISAACGGSLNNSRLLVQEKYEDGHPKGDFSVLLWSMVFLSAIVSFVLFEFTYSQSNTVSILAIFFVILCLIRSYAVVEYRIVLNYKKVLNDNICVAFGIIIGLVIYLIFGNNEVWLIPFIGGEVFGCVYLFKTTTIIKEPVKVTGLFPLVLGKETILLLSSVFANILMYLDRLLLLPLLGGAAVSNYSVASFFGKGMGIMVLPLSGVMLSYFARKEFKMDRKLFWKINVATILVGFLAFMVSLVVAPFFTKLFYSKIFDEAKEYIIIANATAIINIVASMTVPSVLKFSPTFWQLVIEVVYCGLYLFGGIVLSRSNGLWGFSIMALITSGIKLIMLYVIGSIFISAEKENMKNKVVKKTE